MNIEEVKDIANQMGISLVNIPNTYENSDYYKLDKASLIEMGIQNSNDEYIINYINSVFLCFHIIKQGFRKRFLIRNQIKYILR